MANYKKKIEQLKARRQDATTRLFSVTESFNKSTYGESATYALEVMEPISATYTANTYKACARVQDQLKPALQQYGIWVEFRFQGSVPTDTHIKNYSDIDMLTLHGAFYTLEPPLVPPIPYQGNPIEDLMELRRKAVRILDTVYTGCDIDDTGSKCVTISGGSLGRKIDIIPSNWYDSVNYARASIEVNRGIQVLDRDAGQRIVNFPFLHIHRINEKDNQVGGNEKRVIRLLKSLRADADESIDVSSYDLASLVYRMDDPDLLVAPSQRLTLLQRANIFLVKVINDTSFRDRLYVANGTRLIVGPDGCKLAELAKLQFELQDLISSIEKEMRPLYGNWEKVNMDYR